jgi:RimJ/RimL family protein N-acetyltransferase
MGEVTPIVLSTPRLILRDFEDDDLLAVHAFRSDADVARYMDFEPETEGQACAWLRETIFHNRKRPREAYNFALVQRVDGLPVGWIGTGRPACRHHWDLDFGYALNRDYWGQGYMTEALGALLRFGFEALGARRMCAECDPHNVASARGMEKAGMRREAHFRAVNWAKGEWRDSLLYAILKHEWEAQKCSPIPIVPT